MSNHLFVIAGPTAVGKSEVSIKLAKHFGTEILSADSRQFYRELNIGTAKPSAPQLLEVPHHFIGHISLDTYYNASLYENDVISLLNKLFLKVENVLLTGGSGLYIDAVCLGIDDIPDPDPSIRAELQKIKKVKGIEHLRKMLSKNDPKYYARIDLNNPARIIRALEICLSTGKPFSAFHTNTPKERPFGSIKIGLERERDELYECINNRVDRMMQDGLLEEVMGLVRYRHLTALKTVGYQELLLHIDGKITLAEAVQLIKRNTRHYARRQLTWFRKDKQIRWFHPEHIEEILEYLNSFTRK